MTPAGLEEQSGIAATPSIPIVAIEKVHQNGRFGHYPDSPTMVYFSLLFLLFFPSLSVTVVSSFTIIDCAPSAGAFAAHLPSEAGRGDSSIGVSQSPESISSKTVFHTLLACLLMKKFWSGGRAAAGAVMGVTGWCSATVTPPDTDGWRGWNSDWHWVVKNKMNFHFSFMHIHHQQTSVSFYSKDCDFFCEREIGVRDGNAVSSVLSKAF